MKIQILGTGCAKCQKLYDATENVAKEMGMEYEMVKVSDINEIMGFGVMMTPALAIDGIVKSSGKIPSKEELQNFLGA